MINTDDKIYTYEELTTFGEPMSAEEFIKMFSGDDEPELEEVTDQEGDPFDAA